jgi:hypothetical protein
METEKQPIIPWLDKQMLEDRKLKLIPFAIVDLENPDQPHRHELVTEKILLDFKTFVLNADNRPIDFQVLQIMLAIKMLMDVCEKQQILIESINAMLKHENQVYKPTDLV